MEVIFYGISFVLGIFFGFFFINKFIVAELKVNLHAQQEKNVEINQEIIRLQASDEIKEENKKYLVTEFENLAAKILKENSNEFSQANKKEIEELVKPLKEQLFEFEKQNVKNTAELKTHIEHLKLSSETLSEDAKKLTEALKGDNKIQGNWGELLLERILEASGLEKEVHYSVQDSFSQDGSRLQTDCIVKLPENRNVIIDSKVSLVPLQNFYNAQDEDDKKSKLKELERSIKSHIETLSSKGYQDIEQVNSADFVLMFMPVEAAFNLMSAEFDNLIDFAWKQRVLIVSPSTLMIALKTISLFWQQEKQNKNALEIARVGGALYDKFVGFADDLNGIATHFKRAQNSFEDAFKKIEGRGGLFSQVQKLQDLGAKTKKQIPQEYLEVE